jgi:non-heme Fe2+,alpha-ketoglutarate-dependent halogenase
VWSTNIFVRGEDAELAWHQDAAYFGWEGWEGRAVRVWVALTPTPPETGTMRYARGTHLDGLVRHGYRGTGVAAVLRGEEVLVEVDPVAAVDVVLEPGECSVHLPTRESIWKLEDAGEVPGPSSPRGSGTPWDTW